MKIKKISAFSLLELVVVLIIVTIFILLAMPELRAFMQNNRTVSLTNEFISALHLVRSEAIKRNSSVSICAATDAQFNACGSNWNNGWIIFTNGNEDGVFANNATEILLKIEQNVDANVTLTANPAIGIITYTSSGFPLSASRNTNFSIYANGCTGNNARNITITPTGRILMTKVAC